MFSFTSLEGISLDDSEQFEDVLNQPAFTTRESHQEQRIGPDSSHVNNSDNNERSPNNVHTEEQL